MSNRQTNIDEAEIAKFSEQAENWWDLNGVYKSLHEINDLRVGFIASRTILSGRKILDLGCGGGILSEALALRGAYITGIDMGEAPLAAARYHMQQSGLEIDYRKSSAENFAESAEESFDVVVCMELLEHVPQPSSIIRACSRLVKPEGDVFFATLNRNIKSYIFAILGAEYLLRLLPRGTHMFRRFVKPKELIGWAEAHRLALQNMMGLHYNPFTRKYSLGGTLHVNYMAHFRKKLKTSG